METPALIGDAPASADRPKHASVIGEGSGSDRLRRQVRVGNDHRIVAHLEGVDLARKSHVRSVAARRTDE